ncbi:MAG: nicotinamidase [Gemmatimonadetes bacterium]|nr:nicotinamidase [Gemmatimonadota bacterium]
MTVPMQLELEPRRGDALILVDVQNDFLPGGALAVREGDAVIPALNRCIARFSMLGLPIVATRDWHPADHVSFRSRGGPWPPHCVAHTHGAQFSGALDLPAKAGIISKAMGRDEEAYSGFSGTTLDHELREANVRRLFVGGLATDYCVLNTVKDARSLGYDVVLLRDAIRAVDVRPGDGERAIAEMQALGAVAADAESVLS